MYPSSRKGSCSIPSTTKGISDGAFDNSTKLETLIFEEGTKNIEYMHFKNCKALKKVVLSSGITQIPKKCFSGCKSLSQINLAGVQKFDQKAFYNCKSLRGEVELNNVIHIYEEAFGGCSSITSIKLVKPSKDILLGTNVKENKSLIFITNPFPNCTSLVNIDIEGECNYKTVDGVLYSAFENDLLCYPAGKTGLCTVKKGVVNIINKAFAGSKASMIVLSDTVNSIYGDGFSACGKLSEIGVDMGNMKFEAKDGVLYVKRQTKLELLCYPSEKREKTFTIPENTFIGENSFSKCNYLKNVYIPDSAIKDSESPIFSNCKKLDVFFPKNAGYTWDYYDVFDYMCKDITIHVYKNSGLYDEIDNEIDYKYKLR